jgi:hypothetical protein
MNLRRVKAVQIFNKKGLHKDYTLMPVSRRPPQNQQLPKYTIYRKIFDTPDASVYYINRTVRSGYHRQMSSDCKVSPSSFSCCVCLEDNKCNDPDDPQTYAAYVKWVKVHRTNYLQSPVALCFCANNHTCSQELYRRMRAVCCAGRLLQQLRWRGWAEHVAMRPGLQNAPRCVCFVWSQRVLSAQPRCTMPGELCYLSCPGSV